jgi:chemotaxis protein CheD
MTRRPVQFGLGDLESKLSTLMDGEESTLAGESPPPGPLTFVHTGEVVVVPGNTLLSTVLGSCVSVCLWDPATGAGGVNHFLLPDQVTNGMSGSQFGNVAMSTLLSRLARQGAPAHALRAKVFGGASVLDPDAPRKDNLGLRNVELARVMLNLASIPIVAEDIGGARGRKLIFRTGDGAAWVRKL